MDVYEVPTFAQFTALQAEVGQLREQLRRYEERGRAMSAEEMYLRAENWIAGNAEGWRYIKNVAHDCLLYNERFSMKRAVENLRYAPLALFSEDEYRICNSCTAALTRFLLREMPELRGHMLVRRSKVDRLFPDVPIGADSD